MPSTTSCATLASTSRTQRWAGSSLALEPWAAKAVLGFLAGLVQSAASLEARCPLCIRLALPFFPSKQYANIELAPPGAYASQQCTLPNSAMSLPAPQQEYINIELDAGRNRLIRLDIVLTAATFAFAPFNLLAGACAAHRAGRQHTWVKAVQRTASSWAPGGCSLALLAACCAALAMTLARPPCSLQASLERTWSSPPF